MRRLAVLALCFVALFALLGAAPRYTPPPLSGHVVDGTKALSPEQTAALDDKLTALRTQTGFAVVVYVAPSLEGLTVEDIAYETFNAWKIGEEGKDNGVLLVIAPNQRKIRIETGKGVGGELTDLESAEILRNHVGPRMREGNLYGAIDQGTTAIQTALVGELPISAAPPRTPEQRPMSPLTFWLLAAGLVVVALLAIVSPTVRLVLFGLLQSFLFSRGGGGGRGGGLSGGGYSGGGGRSGGGGASGDY